MSKESSLPPQVIYQTYNGQDDEIDISVLFNKIWVRRKFILAFVFVLTVTVAGFLAIILLKNPPEKRYSQIIQFNFPNAEKGLYPGGQKFSYNDMVSAKVLGEVYQSNDLKSQNISFKDFIKAISINPFAENARFIKEKYQSLLTNKKLSRPEIESLEKDFLDELNISQSRFVRLSILESSFSGIDPILAQKILIDIPKVWSRNAIDELGVLNLKIVGADFYQPSLVDRFEYLQILEYLQENTKVLESALKEFSEDEIGGLVRDETTGITAHDLKIQLRNLMSFEIEPLFSTITNLGITKDPQKAMIYLKNSIQNFQDKKLVLFSKAENLEKVINQYVGMGAVKMTNKPDGAAGGYAQYDSSFLDKFTALIEDKSDKLYIQKILNDRLFVLQEVEEIEGQIIKFKRAEERLKLSENTVSEKVRNDVVKEIFISRDNFESLIAGYKNLLEVRNNQVMGNTSILYRLTSNDVLIETDIVSKIKKIIMISVLVSVVALMLAVIIALFKRLPEAPKRNELNAQ